MRPFNLQEALEGKPVITRSGRPVKISGYNPDAKMQDEKVIGWVEGECQTWCEDGSWHPLGFENDDDLFMAPKPKVKKTGYVAVYPSGLYAAYCNHRIYRTEQEAADNQEADNKELKTGPLCIAKVEWEEEA